MIKATLLCLLLIAVVASGQRRSKSSFRRTHNQPGSFSGQNFAPRQQTFTHTQQTFNEHDQSFSPVQQTFSQLGGANQRHVEPKHYVIVPIISYNQQGPENGHYSFDFETGDGIIREEHGSPDPNGGMTQRGSWSHLFPDGTHGEFRFVSDRGGYRVESPLLPQAPPIPAHAQEQIERAERERAQGIFHDGFYDHARYGGPGVLSALTQQRRTVPRRRFN